MSRHTPTQLQIDALREMFGEEITVEQEARPFDDAREIARRYRSGGYDDKEVRLVFEDEEGGVA